MITTRFKGEGELKATLSNMERKLLTRKLMQKLSLQGITEIFETTVEDGKDKLGKPFKPYSPNYFELKKKRGGRFFSSSPNLFDKGAMLGNLSNKVVSKSSAFLHFPKIKERLKASGHIKGSKRLSQRDFFGLIRASEKVLLRITNNHIKELANG